MKTTALLLALVNSPYLDKGIGTFRLESDESKTDQIWNHFRTSRISWRGKTLQPRFLQFRFVNIDKLLPGTYIWAYNAEEQLGTQFYNLRDLSLIDENGTEISLYYIGK